jgi:hypothetical protein
MFVTLSSLINLALARKIEYSAAGKFCPFRKKKWRLPKINGTNWKNFGSLLANDCRFRNFTLSFWAKSNWRY